MDTVPITFIHIRLLEIMHDERSFEQIQDKPLESKSDIWLRLDFRNQRTIYTLKRVLYIIHSFELSKNQKLVQAMSCENV